MDINKLVHMANRIGDFFQAMPDRTQAQRDLADHIRKFWEPRMRKTLRIHLDTTSASGLHPFVREALLANQELWG